MFLLEIEAASRGGQGPRETCPVAGDGLRQAATNTTTAMAISGDDPLRRLHALADAYVSIIREQPHVHDLAYGHLGKSRGVV